MRPRSHRTGRGNGRGTAPWSGTSVTGATRKGTVVAQSGGVAAAVGRFGRAPTSTSVDHEDDVIDVLAEVGTPAVD